MTDAILTALMHARETLTASDLVFQTGLPRKTVELALLDFQENEQVFMSGGKYWLSEHQRKVMASA